MLSACGSSVSEMARHQHEPDGVGEAMLLAGSASVIGTVWSIDDLAGLIHSCLLYERIVEADDSPFGLVPEARRRMCALSGAKTADLLYGAATRSVDLDTLGRLRQAAEQVAPYRAPFAHPTCHRGVLCHTKVMRQSQSSPWSRAWH